MTIKNDVVDVISTALEIDKNTLLSKDKAENIEEWDSLGHLSVLVALDRYFKGKISTINDMAEADSLSKIFTILEKNNLL